MQLPLDTSTQPSASLQTVSYLLKSAPNLWFPTSENTPTIPRLHKAETLLPPSQFLHIQPVPYNTSSSYLLNPPTGSNPLGDSCPYQSQILCLHHWQSPSCSLATGVVPTSLHFSMMLPQWSVCLLGRSGYASPPSPCRTSSQDQQGL
jgi:hypothetical protein